MSSKYMGDLSNNLQSRRAITASQDGKSGDGFTPYPDQQWVEQQARNMTMEELGCLRGCPYLLQDRDANFCQSFRALIKTGSVNPFPLPARSPNLNASCESFMKTLKREEIYARDYRDLEHLLESVEGFIENYYNRCRLHSALGYRPPEEFENESEDRVGDARFGAATMRVFKTLTGTQN